MLHRHRIGRAIGAGAVACLVGAARVAHANGALPSVDQLLVDPAAPDHLYLRATFGLLRSFDRGQSWDWLCEAGMGYADLEPPMAVLPGGTVLLAIPEGVSRGDASGCNFERAKGIDANVIDLSRIAAEPGSAVAVSISGTVTELWRTDDDGRSFAPLGDPIEGLIAATVDVGPSNPKVMYQSGLANTQGGLLRSKDAGKTFESFPVPNTTTGRRPYIAAVNPSDEDTVYVRLVGVQVSLEVTRDGGRSFETVLKTATAVQGFALSPDGKTVLASNGYDGTFRASTDDYAFEKIACGGRSCLNWSEAGLFGCGDDMLDGYVVGRSEDEGATFERVIDLSCVSGPLACDEGTSVGSVCPAAWPSVQQRINATECAPRDVAPYTGCFAGAGGEGDGTGGTGGSGGTAAGRAGASGKPSSTGRVAAKDSGCALSAAQHEAPRAFVAVLLGLGALCRRRLGGARHARR